MYNACNWFLIRNFFEEEKFLISSHSRTFLVRNSELLKRKRIDRAHVENRVDSQMFMLPMSEAEALNIVVIGPCWEYGWTNMLSFKYLSMAFQKSGKPGQDVCLILFWGRIF